MPTTPLLGSFHSWLIANFIFSAAQSNRSNLARIRKGMYFEENDEHPI